MNERIRELIKQHGINITIDGFGYGEGNVERLAELIVKECIVLAEQYGSGGAGSEFDVGYISCANTLSEEFKKLFGVDNK